MVYLQLAVSSGVRWLGCQGQAPSAEYRVLSTQYSVLQARPNAALYPHPSRPRQRRRRWFGGQVRRQDRLVESRIRIRLESATAADFVVRPQSHARVEGVVLAALVLVAWTAGREADGH